MNFPILSTLIFLPLVSSLFIFLSKGQKNNFGAIYISLFASIATFILSLFLWYSLDYTSSEFQFVEEKTWINDFIKFKLGVDGISILFIVLTTFITPICIISCINSVKDRVKEFLIAILILETFMIGVFCSLDLVIFYLFFEAGLIPMFLIIGVWGGPKRVYSAFKFFLFTLLGSVLMLVAIILIYWLTGTTDITEIYEIKIPKDYQNLLWLAFFSSFAVKTPMWPVHTWLPDAHVEAPTAGSVILAAILLKMAGYGFLRFSIPMFPVATEFFTPLIYFLSIVAIIYTSLVALMQDDMKKLIAYSSVAHMGYVTLGIFTLTKQGIEGSIFQMLSHGLISAALFLCVGVVYDRMHSRLISTYGGLVSNLPKYSFLFIIFALAALGLPGTTGFLGEFLVLVGSFQKNYLVAMLATVGVVLGAAYMLWLTKRVIFGNIVNKEIKNLKDINKLEIIMLATLAFLIIFFGFYPSLIIETLNVSVDNLINDYEKSLTGVSLAGNDL
ncbi:MAG: NADH-quinone oxidoreductase subunit M [Candidatus Pelagibacter sp. TMED197]|nr:NADH-quinone oxidoreductase subunit M [Candidatus Pelagibacter sp.]OUW58807.1 MAG: NADH-quinone oxidoreductase subunit M [Candidatus Pelagibacter sp. TMED197]